MTTDPGAGPDPAKFDSEPTKTRLVMPWEENFGARLVFDMAVLYSAATSECLAATAVLCLCHDHSRLCRDRISDRHDAVGRGTVACAGQVRVVTPAC
jgi:hypothetical protein